jgi:hypothetical protein
VKKHSQVRRIYLKGFGLRAEALEKISSQVQDAASSGVKQQRGGGDVSMRSGQGARSSRAIGSVHIKVGGHTYKWPVYLPERLAANV